LNFPSTDNQCRRFAITTELLHEWNKIEESKERIWKGLKPVEILMVSNVGESRKFDD